MPVRNLPVALLLWLALAASAPAQFKQGDPQGAKLGEARLQRMEVGVIVNAAAGPCRGIVAYMAVPDDWPEQEVRIVEEDVSHGVRVTFRKLDGMVKAMQINIQSLQTGKEAKAIITFEVRRSPTLAPADTAIYAMPDLKKLDRKLRMFLIPSPGIESRDSKIRLLARQIGADEKSAWKRVEAIYDWVREKVKYKFDEDLKGALVALKTGVGDCEEMTSLFIAICRAADVPARTVHVQGHCYPEFYLVDDKGKGHWFPCQAAGTRAFGEMPEYRPILQKGDNIRPPHDRRNPKRYFRNYLTGTGGEPRVRFIRRMVTE